MLDYKTTIVEDHVTPFAEGFRRAYRDEPCSQSWDSHLQYAQDYVSGFKAGARRKQLESVLAQVEAAGLSEAAAFLRSEMASLPIPKTLAELQSVVQP